MLRTANLASGQFFSLCLSICLEDTQKLKQQLAAFFKAEMRSSRRARKHTAQASVSKHLLPGGGWVRGCVTVGVEGTAGRMDWWRQAFEGYHQNCVTSSCSKQHHHGVTPSRHRASPAVTDLEPGARARPSSLKLCLPGTEHRSE